MKTSGKKTLFLFLALTCLVSIKPNAMASGDTTFLRVSIHVFNSMDTVGNFQSDSVSHVSFLNDMIGWINHQMVNLDTLKPVVSSGYVKTLGIQIKLDSIYYHEDEYAWDCSEGIDSDYMRKMHVDEDSTLNYRQKYRTLPVFLGGNYSIVGGHNSLIGDKWFIAMRGMFSEFTRRSYNDAVRDCGRGLLHELGHSLGLAHNFSGGPHGDQCDGCEDNGCPEEGSSNNIMDYWPSYGYALSECQKEIVWDHLNGYRGNIAEVIWNDSCYREEGQTIYLSQGSALSVSDTSYLHSDLVLTAGASLIVNSYLSIPEGCSITIEPGANLIVENGTLGNLCGDIWEGLIVLQGDSTAGGVIKFDNARIENAKTGITIEGDREADINQTLFINNLSSLKISGSSGSRAIRNCRFEIYKRLNHWEEGLVPESFVWLDDVDSILFHNCSFYNSEGHRAYADLYSGIGIIAENSNLNLNSCKFENLFKGVVISSGTSENELFVDSCFYELNHCNIQLTGLFYARIKSSFFNLNRLNTLPVYGISASNTMIMEIANNEFYSDYGGANLTAIISDQKHSGTHLINNNNFSLIDEGIVVINDDSPPQWPEALLDYSYEDLTITPLGCIWVSNTFSEVKKQVISLDTEGGGLLKSIEGEYDLFSIDWSKAFKGEGFGLYSKNKDVCIVRPYEDYNIKMPSGILFHILSDNSWIGGQPLEVDLEHSNDIFIRLGNEYLQGILFADRDCPASHKEMVSVAVNMEKHPWLIYTPQFGSFLDRQACDIPSWIWKEMGKALESSNWWKLQLHHFIISLAKYQIKEKEINISNTAKNENGFTILPFAEIIIQVSADIGRLNAGSFGTSSFPYYMVVPNPSHDEIGIRFKNDFPIVGKGGGLDWIVRDVFGRTISSGFINGAEDLMIDAGVIPAGSYFIEIWKDIEFLGSQKFIILPD